MVCRKLGSQVHISVHPFFFSLVSALGCGWLLALSHYTIGSLNRYDLIMLTLCGLCSWIQQESQALALQLEKGGRSAAINYMIVVNAFLADIIIFGE